MPWTCYVDGEKVQPQEGMQAWNGCQACIGLTDAGDFYGGWVTSELEGPMKGGPGTWGW